MPEELNIKLKSFLSPGVIVKSRVKGCTPIAMADKLKKIIKRKNNMIPEKYSNRRKILPSPLRDK